MKPPRPQFPRFLALFLASLVAFPEPLSRHPRLLELDWIEALQHFLLTVSSIPQSHSGVIGYNQDLQPSTLTTLGSAEDSCCKNTRGFSLGNSIQPTLEFRWSRKSENSGPQPRARSRITFRIIRTHCLFPSTIRNFPLYSSYTDTVQLIAKSCQFCQCKDQRAGSAVPLRLRRPRRAAKTRVMPWKRRRARTC